MPDPLVLCDANVFYSIQMSDLPDPDDRHVLTAAIEAKAQIVLTYKLRDFPAAVMTTFGISALQPDEFLCQQMRAEPMLVLEAIEKMRMKRKRPEISKEQFFSKLARLSIPDFIRLLGCYNKQNMEVRGKTNNTEIQQDFSEHLIATFESTTITAACSIPA
ncbi:MAG: PIN domain-containing protein [Acidobacteria bacterium]|nr:PIN domain-containing protein [Acidobacteriota bacterium]